MSISIRRTQDFESVVNLNSEIFPGELLDVSASVYAWIGIDSKAGKQVGFCTATNLGYRVLFLSRCGVRRDYRGLSLQRRFINVRLNFAIQNNYRRVITYVHRTNGASLNNLLRCGFKIYEPEEWNGPEFIYLMYECN